MADDMCGPSNAMQNFQKHTTVDRTLQQDRLLNRQSPSQGFRSSPGPNSGLVDREFEAFQAGHFTPEPQTFPPQPFSHAHPPPQLHQQPGPSNWASDFQRLNISPSPQTQQYTPQRQDAGWHQEFARQNHMQTPTPTQQLSLSPYQYSPMSRMGMNYNAQSFTPQTQSIPQQKAPEQFDDEAFARAFEAAARNEELHAQESTQSSQSQDQDQDQNHQFTQHSAELGQDILLTASDATPRIGADQIHDPVSGTSEQRPDAETDPDALARTAGQLLNSVRHEQSAKFQNSQFLELMRRVRDREVQVVGDGFVGAESGAGGDQWEMESSLEPPPDVEAFTSHG